MTTHVERMPMPTWSRPWPAAHLSPRASGALKKLAATWAALTLAVPGVPLLGWVAVFALPLLALVSPLLLLAARGVPLRRTPARRALVRLC